MRLRMKFIAVLAALVFLGGAYWLGTYATSAQMGMQQQAPATEPMENMATMMNEMMNGMMGNGMGSAMPNELMSNSQEYVKQKMGMHRQAPAAGPTNNMATMMAGMMNGMMGNSMGLPTSNRMMSNTNEQTEQMIQSCNSMMGEMSQMQLTQPDSSANAVTEKDLVRTSMQTGDQLSATFQNSLMDKKEMGGKLIFKITMEGHSNNLMDYDLAQSAILRNSEGLVVDSGFLWEPAEESIHHIDGLLTIDSTFDGQSIIGENTEYIELEIASEDSPWQFKWEGAVLNSLRQ